MFLDDIDIDLHHYSTYLYRVTTSNLSNKKVADIKSATLILYIALAGQALLFPIAGKVIKNAIISYQPKPK